MPKLKTTKFISFLGVKAQVNLTEEYFSGVNHWEIITENEQPIPITETGYRSNFFYDHATMEDVLDIIAERNGIPRTQIQLLDEPFTPKEDNTYTDTKDALKTHIRTQSKELQQGYLF
jgi:hypothetical protein